MKKMINWEEITLGKRVKFEDKKLKKSILNYCQRSTFSKLLEAVQIELPVKLQDFDETENSFKTNHGEKISLDKEHGKIYVQKENTRKTYIIEVLSEASVVLLKNEEVN